MTCLNVTKPGPQKARIRTEVFDGGSTVPDWDEPAGSELLLGVRGEQGREVELHGVVQY